MSAIKVASAADLPLGSTQLVTVDGIEILLCHTAEGIFAVGNRCTHADERLCDGKLKGTRILCPLHGAAFDVRDGAALSRPATIPLPCYAVQVIGDDILVKLEPAP